MQHAKPIAIRKKDNETTTEVANSSGLLDNGEDKMEITKEQNEDIEDSRMHLPSAEE